MKTFLKGLRAVVVTEDLHGAFFLEPLASRPRWRKPSVQYCRILSIILRAYPVLILGRVVMISIRCSILDTLLTPNITHMRHSLRNLGERCSHSGPRRIFFGIFPYFLYAACICCVGTGYLALKRLISPGLKVPMYTKKI